MTRSSMVLIAMLLFAAPAYAGNDKPLDFSGINSEELQAGDDPFAPIGWPDVTDNLDHGRRALCANLARSMEKLSRAEMLKPLSIASRHQAGGSIRLAQGVLEIADDLLAISKKHCQPPKEKVQ